MPVPDAKLAILVLASGGGTRLGGGKLLLPWRGRPLLLHTLDAASTLPADIPLLVTTGHEAPRVEEAVKAGFSPGPRPFRILRNPDWQKGQSTSLRLGIQAIVDEFGPNKSVLVMLGDQPAVSPNTLAKLATAHTAAHPATAPMYNDQRGNPVVLSPALFPEIMRLEGDVGARALLKSLGDSLRTIEVDDPGVVRDIDTPEAYDALQRDQTGA